MNVLTVRHWLAAGCALALGCGAARAQGRREAQDAQLRNDCRLASQILVTGQPRPHYEWALSFISLCDARGPEALSHLWSETTGDADTVRLERLVFQSQRLRDARLLGALGTALNDAARPAAVRIAALRVLISYVAPLHDANAGSLSQERPTELLRFCMLNQVVDAVQRDGANPVTRAQIDSIVAGVHEIGSRESNPALRAAARCAANGMTNYLAAHP